METINWPLTPITEESFERQGWEKHIDTDGFEPNDDNPESVQTEYYYFVLPLPRDNPDERAPCLISTTNDEYQDFPELKKGEYYVEMDGAFGLGLCRYEEEIDILYKSLTGIELTDDKVS
jgi:hypothetical protein|tara:strand:- start:46 stop:405 length:360 start_codon:yes stop_codon:yes gene_type:complete